MLDILVMSFLAGIATLIGSGAVMIGGRPNRRSLALFLGAAAGIMTGVVLFDLIPSAYAYGSFTGTAGGFVLGVFVLFLLDNSFRVLVRNFYGMRHDNVFLRMGMLIAVGIALHDFPEGVAIAAGYSAEAELGLLIAVAITLHNIPEGMACTAPLWMGGIRRRHILLIIVAVSLVTPLGALAGMWLFSVSPRLLSWLLAFAAGAMSYIVSMELVPQAIRSSLCYSAVGIVAGLAFIQIIRLI